MAAKVVVKKIPHHLKGFFKEAIKAGAIAITLEGAEQVVVTIYKEVSGPLGDFFNSIPNTVEQFGHNAAEVVQEACNEVGNFVVHTIGDPVVQEVENFGHTIESTYHDVSKTVETAYHDVGNFFSHLF